MLISRTKLFKAAILRMIKGGMPTNTEPNATHFKGLYRYWKNDKAKRTPEATFQGLGHFRPAFHSPRRCTLADMLASFKTFTAPQHKLIFPSLTSVMGLEIIRSNLLNLASHGVAHNPTTSI